MKKLHLNPEQLRVDSFSTASVETDGGTVHAHATPPTARGTTCGPTCQTNCDCTFTCTQGFPATQCPIWP